MTTNKPYTCTGCGEVLRHIRCVGTHAQTTPSCTPQMRFWGKVDKSAGPNACWPWKAWCNPRFGYGMSTYKGEAIAASKVAWIYTHGEPKKGEHVCHKCDNPICCNPAHFFLGTHKQNMEDKFLKHRDKRAIHPDKIREMRKAFAADTAKGCVARVARKFGIGEGVACQIRLGKKYGYVK